MTTGIMRREGARAKIVSAVAYHLVRHVLVAKMSSIGMSKIAWPWLLSAPRPAASSLVVFHRLLSFRFLYWLTFFAFKAVNYFAERVSSD